MFVGNIALIAWRVQRRFGAGGVVVLTAVFCLIGLVRDFTVAAIFPEMIFFGPLPDSALADVAVWAIIVLVALLVSRLVSGPASLDPFRT
jgi:hypothetical protein